MLALPAHAVPELPSSVEPVGDQSVGEIAPSTAGGPLRVEVAVYLMGLGKPDLTTGAFSADFYLVMTCDVACDPSGFELRNGKATSVDEQESTATHRVFRVNAQMTAPLVLHEYPFDHHELIIDIEDRLRPTSELVYVPADTNHIDPAVQVPGWDLVPESVATSVDVHKYPVFDAPFDEYSMFRYAVTLERAPLASFMKVLFPALAIMATALVGLLLKPGSALNRLGIHTGALTAAILFHLNVTAGIPPTGYLVDADRFMVANYAGLVTAVLSTVLIMIRHDDDDASPAATVYRAALVAVPVVWIGAQLFAWLG